MFAISMSFSAAAAPESRDWNAVLTAARGQTVYWHAWAGSARINAFIAWAGNEVEARYGVKVQHVKLADTADAVSRVIAEKSSGRDRNGAIDLVWINGENFAAMKSNGLLYGPWAESLPNWTLVDVEGKPAVTHDFTVPTGGLEAPWSMAQVVFYYDTARLPRPPRSIPDLFAWIVANPGRFTFPQPPDFLGSTFLKQALHGLIDDRSILLRPVVADNYEAVTAPLWAFLDKITPQLWRSGRAYPQNGPRQIQLMADGEIDLAISFSPGEASAAIDNGELPVTVRTFVFDGGTLGNANFVAIPYNARAKEGAMVLANFLLSPEAQARKQDPGIWGSGTVLALERLPPRERERFTNLRLGIATLSPEELGPALPEPHPSWMIRIEADWTRRFGVTR
ncbi:MAG: ABC transporter substrate-binding protein [Alphaproteobacteria bacterium]